MPAPPRPNGPTTTLEEPCTGRAVPVRGRPASHRTPRRRVHLVLLAAAYAFSRIVAASIGVRYDDSVLSGTRLTDMWQLLDVRVLRGELLEGVWHLNMQPPLLNVYAGALLKLPHGLRQPAEVTVALALGLVLVLTTYLVLVELSVPPRVSLGVTLVGIVASPAYLLYENWFDDAYPTAALMTVAVWCLARYLRTSRARFGVGFFASYAAVVMLNSTYQVEWLLGAGVVVLVAARHQWRRVVLVAAVPLLVVASWYVKDLVLFGTSTTSSWFGMNLGRDVLFRAPPGRIAQLQRDGVLSPLASVPPFADPHAYAPRFATLRPDPDPALGALYKANGAPNFNNPVYIPVASRYLHDDVAFIRAEPWRYAADVGDSVQVWLVGTDQNFTNSVDWPRVGAYARLYDRVIEWQPTQDPAPGLVVFRPSWHRPVWLSGQAVAVYLLALAGAPVIVWRRRRVDRAFAGTLAVLWWTTLYGLAASSLVEIGENERFRFDLGPVPLVLAVTVVTEVVRALSVRRRASQPPLAPNPAAPTV